MSVVRGHRDRPGVDWQPAPTLTLILPDYTEPELPRASLTSLHRHLLCDGCMWPLTCSEDRTCWVDEPRTGRAFTGALQARAERLAREARNGG